MLLFNVNRNISSKRFFTSAPFLSFFPQINMVVPNHTCDWDFEFEPLYAYVCGLCVWFIYFQTYINCLLKCFFFQSQLWLMHMHTCVSVHFICIYSSIRNTPKAVEHGWLVFSSVSLFYDLQNKNNNLKGAEQQRRKQTFAFQQIKGMIRVKKSARTCEVQLHDTKVWKPERLFLPHSLSHTPLLLVSAALWQKRLRWVSATEPTWRLRGGWYSQFTMGVLEVRTQSGCWRDSGMMAAFYWETAAQCGGPTVCVWGELPEERYKCDPKCQFSCSCANLWVY